MVKNGQTTSINYLDSGLFRPHNACEELDPNLPNRRELGKPVVRLSSTFNLCVKLRTLDSRVENRFSAVNNSNPSSSSSSPEDKLSTCSGGCLDGRELLNRCMCRCNRSSLSLQATKTRIIDSLLSIGGSNARRKHGGLGTRRKPYLCNEENGDSSSLASDNRELILRGLPNLERGTLALDGVPPVLLSGSTLPDLGVTYPPPSTAMGIIYSRGLFRIGSGPTVDPRALSVSESAVD